MSTKRYSVGIDLGGTRIKIGLIADGSVVEKKIVAAKPSHGLQQNLPMVKTNIESLLVENNIPKTELQGIGFAFPGLVNPETKQILSTNKKYDDALNINLETWVSENFGLPLYLENDARMSAIGEWKYGEAKGTDNLVVMTIGTGIGTAAIMEGKLVRGKHFQAGCLGGHFTINYKGLPCTCGNIGCVEAHGATWSLGNVAKQFQVGDTDIPVMGYNNFETLFSDQADGDAQASILREECLMVWSAGIINLIHAYDPEIVVMGGGAMNHQEKIIPYIKERVQRLAWCPWGNVEIKATKLLSNAGLLGVTYGLYNPI